MAWRTIPTQVDLVKWDAPKTLRGEYVGSEQREKDGKLNLLHRLNVAGKVGGFFGTTLLNEAFAAIKVGTLVEVEFTGEQVKTPNGRMKIFNVRVWEGEAGDDDAPLGDKDVPF